MMQIGRKRTDGPYRWPATLRLPPRPPTLVYLDMLHWIALAKAHNGHPDGRRHEETLAALVNAQASGTAVFPISDSIFFETSQIGQHRQRRDLRDVIELLSEYFVVTSRSVISTHEIEALLDDLVGPSSRPINAMDYLGWGVARAFGIAGGSRIYDEHGADITEDARLAHPGGPDEFDRLHRSAELELVRNVLAGPAPDEEAQMRSLGWRPGNESDVGTKRAEQEREQQSRFKADPRWRKGRIRDLVAAREVVIEVNRILTEAVNDRAADLAELFSTPEHARAAFDSMPSFDVAVTL